MEEKPKKWVNYAAEICKSKTNGGVYINVKKDFKALKGNSIQMTKFSDYLDGLCGAGKITEADRDRRKETQSFIKYVLAVPPQEFKETDDSKESESGWVNNALEIRKNEKGMYIKVSKDFEVKEGQAIQLQKFEDHVKMLLDKGFIDQEKYDKRIENKEWLKYMGSVAPIKK